MRERGTALEIGITEFIAAIVSLLMAIGGGFAYLLNYFKPLIGATEDIQRLASVMQQDVSKGQQIADDIHALRGEAKSELHALLNEVRQQRYVLRLLSESVANCAISERGCPAADILLGLDMVNPKTEESDEHGNS
jgi:hypothetical protein